MAIRIEHYGSDDDFTLLGHTFHGIKDFEDYIELSVYEASLSIPNLRLRQKDSEEDLQCARRRTLASISTF